MSDEEEDIEEDEDGEESEEKEGSGGGKKKLFLIIGVVVLLLGGGGAGAYFMFAGGEPEKEEVVVIPPGPPVYHEFPQLVVDLKKKGARTNYIKLKVVVEIVTRDLPLLVAQELKIVDKMQGYLRSQTRDEVAGGAGTENMRNGITKIVTEVMGEVKIEGVLFREILLQ
ncbi:MAG: flagellar basal body-associated FliL family protein [Rhodospirillaceae bacterium]|nr:flagellar basal body-associated FliL family protein [Rhodospirillaceae bacterium]